MRILIGLVLLILIVLSSCGGRKTKHEALNESITKFKDSIKPIEIVEYIPNEYSEILTDTILDNGFSISIKVFTDMEKSIIHKYKVDTITSHVNIYREWISEVKIKKDDVVILNETINDDFFLKNNIQISDFSTDALNIGAKFDEEYSIEKEYINLFIGFISPDSKSHKIYNMKIDKNGNYTLMKELEPWEIK